MAEDDRGKGENWDEQEPKEEEKVGDSPEEDLKLEGTEDTKECGEGALEASGNLPQRKTLKSRGEIEQFMLKNLTQFESSRDAPTPSSPPKPEFIPKVSSRVPPVSQEQNQSPAAATPSGIAGSDRIAPGDYLCPLKLAAEHSAEKSPQPSTTSTPKHSLVSPQSLKSSAKPPMPINTTSRSTAKSPQTSKSIRGPAKSPQASISNSSTAKSPRTSISFRFPVKLPEASISNRSAAKSPQISISNRTAAKSPRTRISFRSPVKSPQASISNRSTVKTPETPISSSSSAKSPETPISNDDLEISPQTSPPDTGDSSDGHLTLSPVSTSSGSKSSSASPSTEDDVITVVPKTYNVHEENQDAGDRCDTTLSSEFWEAAEMSSEEIDEMLTMAEEYDSDGEIFSEYFEEVDECNRNLSTADSEKRRLNNWHQEFTARAIPRDANNNLVVKEEEPEVTPGEKPLTLFKIYPPTRQEFYRVWKMVREDPEKYGVRAREQDSFEEDLKDLDSTANFTGILTPTPLHAYSKQEEIWKENYRLEDNPLVVRRSPTFTFFSEKFKHLPENKAQFKKEVYQRYLQRAKKWDKIFTHDQLKLELKLDSWTPEVSAANDTGEGEKQNKGSKSSAKFGEDFDVEKAFHNAIAKVLYENINKKRTF